MGYLFLFISLLYSFIFYFFYIFSQKRDVYFQPIENNIEIINRSVLDAIIFSSKETIVIQSFFGNLFYETVFFFIVGITLFFLFQTSKVKEEKEIQQNKVEKKIDFILLLKNFSYYIGFLLFYLALYFISLGFDIINFSTFIFLINILIFILFFLFQNQITKDFLRINSIIFSLFYIINYIYIIHIDNNYFTGIDFINSFLILFIFPTLLYHDKKIAKKESFDDTILIHFSVYIFVVFLFYFYFYIFHENLIFWISVISTVFGMIWFEGLPKIKSLKKDCILFKYIGIIFTYIGIIFGIIYLFFHHSIFIVIILGLQIGYNFFIHKKYTNYISFVLGIFLSVYLLYYNIVFYSLIDYKSLVFLIFGFILSFGGVLLTYLIKSKIMLDYYIIHIFCHIINIMSLILFLIFNKVQILHIGILLLLESIYFFLSYYKLNPVKNEEKKLKKSYDVHISQHH